MGLLFQRFARAVVSIFSILGLVGLYSPVPYVAAQAAPKTIIKITVQDSAGVAVKNAGVNVHPTDFKYSLFGNSDASGLATIQDFGSNVKSGDALVADVFPPFDGSGSGLIAPPAENLGTYSGTELAAKTVKFKTATKTLTGKATTAAGEAVATTNLNFFKEAGGFAQTKTDASGNYTIKLSGGKWNIHAPSDGTGSFVMSGPPIQAGFKEDDSVETVTVNIDNFVKVNATITGTIKTPDGSALTQGTGLGIRAGHDFGFGAPLQITPGASSVNFSAKVAGDKTYNLDIFSPPNFQNPSAAQFAAPAIEPFSIKTGETKNLGTLTLVKKEKEIKVVVKNGAAGMNANVFKMGAGGPGGGEFGFAILALSGTEATGTIKVVGGGKYGVMVMTESFGPEGGEKHQQQQAGSSKVVKGGPQFVEAGGTATFEALDADATIKARIIRSDTSAVVSDSFGFMEVNSDTIGFLGKPIQRGTATINVPGDNEYKLNPMMPMGGFMPEGSATVKLAKNETKSVDIKLVPTDATIAVKLVKSDGSAITGVFAHAFAISDKGVNVMGDFAGHGGAASVNNIKVVAGQSPYRVGAFVEPGSGFAMVPPKDKVSVAAGATAEVKVTLKALDSKIQGKVTDPDGNAIVGARVKADNGLDDDHRDAAKGPVPDFFEFGGQTDANGSFSIDVTSSETQNVHVFMAPEVMNKNGWLPPAEQIVSVGSKETKTGIDFKFRKADFKFEGTVKDSSGNAVNNALVSAYSDDGAVNQVRTGSDGKYSMNATKDTVWHLDVAKDADNQKDTHILPGEKLVDTKGQTTNLSQDLSLTTQSNVLPADASRTGGSGSATAISLSDGMNIQVPADSLDKNNDDANVTVNVGATAEMPAQEGASVFGKAYDITATDANGSDISSPNSPLTVTFPYKESDIPVGVKEADIQIVSFNETDGSLSKENCTVDTAKNEVSCLISHLTVFGLVANSDTVPPAAPTEVKATAGTGKISLSWKNPSDSDFDKINIYRSTESGKLGDKVKTTDKADTSYDDSLNAKGTYYYTLRSVDTSSNESTNTDQVSAEVKALPTTGRPSNVAGAAAVLLILAGALTIGLIRRNAAVTK